MINTYEKAVAYLESFIPYTIYNTNAYKKTEDHDPLDRMRYFLSLLKNPEKKFQSVIVGGTSGKGSTSYLISHILTTGGYKTSLTLSPHLVRINERMQIQNREISNSAFIDLVNSVKPAIEQMKKSSSGVPSYFEITIGMAFLYFAKENVDLAVLEVGMGGKYDATNTVDPLLAVLTNVSLDHTQFLGETVEEIAKTKVGIIKKGKGLRGKGKESMMVVTGVTQPSVIEIVEEQVEKVGAKLFRLGKDFPLTDIPIGLAGEYQRENASLAREAILQLQQFGFKISEDTIAQALKTARFDGRFEVKKFVIDNSEFEIVLDGAHNQAKMHAFVDSLKKHNSKKKFIFVISFKKDKNIQDMLAEIVPYAQAIVVTQFQIGTDTMISDASVDVLEIESKIRKLQFKGDVLIEKDSKKAVERAISFAKEKETIIAITGSLYLIGEIKIRNIV